jgi:hypothetical protein
LRYTKRPPDRPLRAPRPAIDEQRCGRADHDQEHEEAIERGAVSCVVVLRRVAVDRISPDDCADSPRNAAERADRQSSNDLPAATTIDIAVESFSTIGA